MANYSTLKAAVADVVKTNGTQAITGANLQSVLLSIINSIGGGGYIFEGVATPSTNAGTPDQNVFYIGGAGTYANFGTSVTVPVGSIGIFKYNGSWTNEQISLGEMLYNGKSIDDVGQKYSIEYFIDKYNEWSIYGKSYVIDTGGIYKIFVKASENGSSCAFLKSLNYNEQTPDFAGGATSRIYLQGNDEMVLDVPQDAKYFVYYNDSAYIPQIVSPVFFDNPFLLGNFKNAEIVIAQQGKSIDTSGNIIDTGNFIISRPISIKAGEAVDAHLYMGGGAAISLTDENGSYYTPVVVGVDGDSTTKKRYTYIAENDCYIAICTNTIGTYNVFVYGGIIAALGYMIDKNSKTGQEPVKLELLMGATPKSGVPLSPTGFGKRVWTTPKYLKTAGAVTLYSPAYFCVEYRKYLADFSYSSASNIMASSYNSVAGRYEISFGVFYKNYIKFNFLNNTNINYATDFVPEIYADGIIEQVFTKPSSNNIALTIPVNVTNPNSCDETTSTVQDTETILYDYGILNLPSTYSNTGKPTRMIVFCHGSAIHYVQGQTTFQTSEYGMDPAYWLSEGYAVMDIEGNPFNNENVHKFVPQAWECYKAAYNYVTSIFNICKDGIFLGGRSLGGGMCFDIITRSNIPVIAACPFVPNFPNSFMMFSFYNATERAFTALHMGMTGDVTWTSSNPLTDGEIAYLTANKIKFVRYTPSWRSIYDLPAFDSLASVAKATGTYNEAEYNLYSSLRIKTNIPVKLFGAFDDTTVPYQRGIQLWYNMLCNGGNICEMRMFETGGHPFDLAAANRVASWVNTRGETLTNVPIAYIEALQFWRRYEQF